MPNAFEKELGIPLPTCCSLGSCCKGASPSTPYHQLLQRASQGDDFARGFFSIMVPYATHAEAEAILPGLVERTLKAAQKLTDFDGPDDVVFYHCQYQTADNRCGVWEDRPKFCRDYPDTPFVVMAPGCAFEPWAKACKTKYEALKSEVAELKHLQDKLAQLKAEQTGLLTESALQPSGDFTTSSNVNNPELTLLSAAPLAHDTTWQTTQLSLLLSLTPLYVGSPLASACFLKTLASSSKRAANLRR